MMIYYANGVDTSLCRFAEFACNKKHRTLGFKHILGEHFGIVLCYEYLRNQSPSVTIAIEEN